MNVARSRAYVGLVETNSPQGGGIWSVVDVLNPERCLEGSKTSRISGLTAGFFPLTLTQFFLEDAVESVSRLSLDPGHVPAVLEQDESKAL